MKQGKETETRADIDLLIQGAVSGSAEDFGRLYDLYVARVYRHIYYRTGNTQDAEDLTQLVFTRAWKAIGRYRKTASPFLAWLMRISHNLVIDYYRSTKDTAYLDSEPAFISSTSSTERLAEEHYNQQELRKAILQLPDDQQQVILMSFIEGFSYVEIAGVLGKREGTVRVILHRALKKLRKILETEKFLR